MKLIAIVAASENNVIGIDNDMPWRLPDDFKFFKQKTMGYPMIMGKNTWKSLGSKPLPGRDHLIISSTLQLNEECVRSFANIDSVMTYLNENKINQAFIIGGGSLYQQMLPYTDEIWMTRIHTFIEDGQIFFPEIRDGNWQKTESIFHPADERHFSSFSFEHWIKK